MCAVDCNATPFGWVQKVRPRCACQTRHCLTSVYTYKGAPLSILPSMIWVRFFYAKREREVECVTVTKRGRVPRQRSALMLMLS